MSWTYSSLFSGYGGLDLGLEWAGWRPLWKAENNADASRILRKHWPHIPNLGDVRQIRWSAYPAPTLLAGGDPCQFNSIARAPHRSIGDRSIGAGPAVHFIAAVEALRPRLVLRENPAVVMPSAPWPWYRFRAALESLGYAVLPFRIRSCCTGACHRRERLFLLAELADSACERLEGIDGAGVPKAFPGGARRFPPPQGWGDVLPVPEVHRSRHEVPRFMERIIGLGNAVDPHVAYWIGGRLLAALEHGRP